MASGVLARAAGSAGMIRPGPVACALDAPFKPELDAHQKTFSAERLQRREIAMATMTGLQSDLVSLLKSIIELDYDAIEAYEAAIARLENGDDKAQFSIFLADHRRHVSDLSLLMREMGEEPPAGPDIKGVLTKGKVVLGSLLGDKAILFAMRTNEADTNTAYERAMAREDLSPTMRMAFETNLLDERRHRNWINDRLGPETDEAAAGS
jgi:rubrerythrin